MSQTSYKHHVNDEKLSLYQRFKLFFSNKLTKTSRRIQVVPNDKSTKSLTGSQAKYSCNGESKNTKQSKENESTASLRKGVSTSFRGYSEHEMSTSFRISRQISEIDRCSRNSDRIRSRHNSIRSCNSNDSINSKSKHGGSSNCMGLEAYEVFRSMKRDSLLDYDYETSLSIINNLSGSTQFVKSYFPYARPSYDILHTVKKELAIRNIVPKNTLYAQSVCPDEINHCNCGIANVFEEYFGESFHLGGLGGIPFAGATGFTAFTHNVPEDGNLFILFAPHIGCSESNSLGQCTRRGQSGKQGNACDAAIKAMEHCMECKRKYASSEMTVNTSEIFDIQMNYIITEVAKRFENIDVNENNDELHAKLAKEMYSISKEYLDRIITLEGWGSENSNLILLGGIQINMPGLLNDYFEPLIFEIRHHNRGKDFNLLLTEISRLDADSSHNMTMSGKGKHTHTKIDLIDCFYVENDYCI